MNRLRDIDDDLRDQTSSDREISLGTPTILGIFFALALVCACFFGFGYILGRKSAPSTATQLSAVPIVGDATAKPAAGSPAGSYAATAPAVVPGSPTPAQTVSLPLTPSSAPAAPALPIGDRPPVPAAAAPPQPTTNNQQPSTSFMVQVAAVSSQDVANIELAALKKDGYSVVVRHEPQDQLLHIQIGPFVTRAAAEAMRARVIADGFNAIVK